MLPLGKRSLGALPAGCCLALLVASCIDTSGSADAGPRDAAPNVDAGVCTPLAPAIYAQSISPQMFMTPPVPSGAVPDSLSYLTGSGSDVFVAYDWGYPSFIGALLRIDPVTGSRDLFPTAGVATNLPLSSPDLVFATFADGGAASIHWSTLDGGVVHTWPMTTFGGPLIDGPRSTFASMGSTKQLWAFVDTAGDTRRASPPERLHLLGPDGSDALGATGAALDSWARPLASAWTRRVTTATTDGGAWYLTDGTTAADPTFGLRAIRRDGHGAVVTATASLADGASVGIQSGDWPGATATYGEWGRGTTDGGLLIHFVTLASGLQSHVARVEPDGHVAWQVESATGVAAALGSDYSDVMLDEVDGGVTAILSPPTQRGQLALWRVNPDGTTPFGSSGVPLYATVVPGSRDAQVQEVEVASDGTGGVFIARSVGTGSTAAVLIGRTAADGSEVWPPIVAPLTAQHDGGWLQMVPDTHGGAWLLLAWASMNSQLQHVDPAGAPLFWERDETCMHGDGSVDYTLLRTYLVLPDGTPVTLAERDHV